MARHHTRNGQGDPPEPSREELRAAREAVMAIPQFPELQTRLTRVFGPTAERDMLHQFVYWFRRPAYRDRDTLYITADQWREQRGLNRKQVNKGRTRLRPFGVIEEKMGPYKRIHYSVNWIRLAELLSVPLEGGSGSIASPSIADTPDTYPDNHRDEWGQKPIDPPSVADAPDTNANKPRNGGGRKPFDTPSGGSGSIASPSRPDSLDTNAHKSRDGGRRTNRGDYSGDYSEDYFKEYGFRKESDLDSPESGEETLPSGDFDADSPDPTSQQKRSATKEKDGDVLPDHEPPRSSMPGAVATETPKLDRLKEIEVWKLLWPPDESTGTVFTRLADHYLDGRPDSDGGPLTVELIAERIQDQLGGEEPPEAYLEPVERGLEARRQDRDRATAMAETGG